MRDGYNQIKLLMAEIAPHLERTDLHARAYSMPTGDIGQIKPDLQILAAEFAIMVQESQVFEDVLKARALVPESRWRDYEIYDFKGLQEQVIYGNALQKLRELWSNERPPYWGKHYDTVEETYGG